jgi:hypothetical protein
MLDRHEPPRVRARGEQLAPQVRGGDHVGNRRESSYTPSSVVVDTYATRNVDGVTANDPTVGLLTARSILR